MFYARKSSRAGPLQERFDRYVSPEPNTGCWLWDGSISNHGYGQMWVGDKLKLAHRISYQLYCGSVPDATWVLHSCDVKICVNPEHLFTGSRQDNTDDMMRKRRHWKFTKPASAVKGEQHGLTTLTSEQVREIRTYYSKESAAKVAPRFNVSDTTIWNIWHGITWSHVT